MNVFQQTIMSIMIYSYIFIIGMCLGSFFMVVGYRVPRNETLQGRSHCENCQKQLSWWHVIPLLSYPILRGKCYYCSSKIGIHNPIFEVLIGSLFVSSAYLLELTPETIVSFTLICLLFTISVSDSVYRIIPNKVLAPFFILIMIERIFIAQNEFWWYPIAGFLAGFLPLYLLGMLNEQAVGGGDIKLFAVVGIFLGPVGVLLALFLSSLLAIIFYLFLFIFQQKKQKFIPFGPSIAVGSWMVYLFTSGQMSQIMQIISR